MLEQHAHYPFLEICAERLGPEQRLAYWQAVQKSRERLCARFAELEQIRDERIIDATRAVAVQLNAAKTELMRVWNAVPRGTLGRRPDENDAVACDLWEHNAEPTGAPARAAQRKFASLHARLQRELMAVMHQVEEEHQDSIAEAQEVYAQERKERLEKLVRDCEEQGEKGDN